jgi:DNA-binding transcriptional ArsR family regulator
MPEIPARVIRDPQVLRALTHPVRLRLLDELTVMGPATATELAERVGESPANCSWHLRQLARYGFVEEAGGGTGRRRPWRIGVLSNTWGPGDETNPELAIAGDAASELVLSQEVEALRAWLPARRSEPPGWREASFVTQSFTWLTRDELASVRARIHEILLDYLDRIADPDQRPAGSRPIRLVAWGIPARPADPSEDDDA